MNKIWKNSSGMTLLELMVVLVILAILGLFFAMNLKNFSSATQVEQACAAIEAFMKQQRIKAFTEKRDTVIKMKNDKELCVFDDNGTPSVSSDDIYDPCVNLDEPFEIAAGGDGEIFISMRGILESGNIHVKDVSLAQDASFSCVVISATRVRSGVWDGTSCTVR